MSTYTFCKWTLFPEELERMQGPFFCQAQRGSWERENSLCSQSLDISLCSPATLSTLCFAYHVLFCNSKYFAVLVLSTFSVFVQRTMASWKRLFFFLAKGLLLLLLSDPGIPFYPHSQKHVGHFKTEAVVRVSKLFDSILGSPLPTGWGGAIVLTSYSKSCENVSVTYGVPRSKVPHVKSPGSLTR